MPKVEVEVCEKHLDVVHDETTCHVCRIYNLRKQVQDLEEACDEAEEDGREEMAGDVALQLKDIVSALDNLKDVVDRIQTDADELQFNLETGNF